MINKNASIEVLTNINNNYINTLDEKIIESLLLDFNASNLHEIICSNNLNSDKTNML